MNQFWKLNNYKKRREELNKRSAELIFDEYRGKKLKGKQPVNNATVNQIESTKSSRTI